MLSDISLGGLMLLRYLQEHSGSSGVRVGLEPKFVWRNLRISESQFALDSAALVEHDFAGMRNFRPNANDVPSMKLSSIWLTKKGADYLKESDAQAKIK